MTRQWRWSLAPCLLVLLSGCTGRAPAPIWIAHVATLSGPDKEAGEAAARGVRLAVEEINKDPGSGVGRPFKVIHSDARGKPEGFEAEAVRLAAINRVAFLLGGNTPEEIERLDRAHLPVLTPCGARTRNLSDAVYFTGLSPAQRGKGLARFAVQDLGLDNFLLVQDERRTDLLETAEAFTREVLTKKDGKTATVRVLRLDKDAKAGDLSQRLREPLEKSTAKAVVFVGKVEELRELGTMSVPVLVAGDDVSARVLQLNKPRSKELYFITAFAADIDAPKAVEFAKRYKAAFSEEADVHAALAYDAMKLLHEATVRSKDSLTLPGIREELVKLKDLPGLSGPLSFTAERQLLRPAFVVRLDEAGVKTVKRYPAE